MTASKLITIERARENYKGITGSECPLEWDVYQIANAVEKHNQFLREQREVKSGNLKGTMASFRDDMDRLPFTYPTPTFKNVNEFNAYCECQRILAVAAIECVKIIDKLKD